MKDIDDIYDITNELIMCCNNVYVNTYTWQGETNACGNEVANEHVYMRGMLMKYDEYDMVLSKCGNKAT